MTTTPKDVPTDENLLKALIIRCGTYDQIMDTFTITAGYSALSNANNYELEVTEASDPWTFTLRLLSPKAVAQKKKLDDFANSLQNIVIDAGLPEAYAEKLAQVLLDLVENA